MSECGGKEKCLEPSVHDFTGGVLARQFCGCASICMCVCLLLYVYLWVVGIYICTFVCLCAYMYA